MKVCLAQMKPCLGDTYKNLEIMKIWIEKGIEEKVDLIVFPELSLTGNMLEELVCDVAIKKVPEELIELSKKISIIFGAVELGEDSYIYNSAFYLENGELVNTYRKVYLPTYGMNDEGRYFKAGNNLSSFDTKFGKIGLLMGEDLKHQTSPFILAQDGATRVFILSNNAVCGIEKNIELGRDLDAMALSAAIANRIFIASVNRVGVEDGVSFYGKSKVFAPTGEILYEGKLLEEECILVDLSQDYIRRARVSNPIAKGENLALVLKELKRIWVR